MNNQERKNRIIAKGEGSDHAHVIVGDAEVKRNENGEIIIEIGNEGAVLKHIQESAWMNGQEVFTGEHGEIALDDMPDQVRQGDVLLEKVKDRTYKYIPQQEFDPYEETIRRVMD